MQITKDTNDSAHIINHYEPGMIQVNKQEYTTSLLISQTELLDWAPQSIDQLQKEHFLTIIELNPAIVIIGCGQELTFPATDLLAELINRQIGYEVMTTAAACRTLSVLHAEGRNAVGALIVS